MRQRAAFVPPVDSPAVYAIAKAILHPMLRFHAGGIEVETREEDLQRLRQLKRQRVMLVPNHPTHFDPLILMALALRIDHDFYYLAAREVFEQNLGLRGWLFRRLGVYSIIRGGVDRDSLTMTQNILTEGKRWLVVFIEGESTLENDRMIAFETGALSLGLRVQEKLLAEDAKPPLYVVPMVMRTTYKPGVETPLGMALGRLEKAVGLTPHMGFTGWEDSRRRIRAIGERVLVAAEETHLLTPKPGQSLTARTIALRERMLTKMESYLEVPPPAGGTGDRLLDRIQAVKNKMDRIVRVYGAQEVRSSPYEQRLLESRRHTFREFYADLRRMINFLTLRPDYLAAPTAERVAELITRLEQEVFGTPRFLYPRTVAIRVGQIRDLRDSLPAYRADKRQAPPQLAASLFQEMTGMLEQLGAPPSGATLLKS